MTISELSSEFDILYNNITSNQAPGLSEYEKSVFLTQAQEAIITELYNGNIQTSFESNEAVTRYLSSLIKTESLKEKTDAETSYIEEKTEDNIVSGKVYKAYLPSDILFVVYEGATIKESENKKHEVIVVPSKHDNIYKLMENPFRSPNSRRVLRLAVGEGKVELISDYNITNYIIRYLKKPTPIILSSLGSDSINGESTATTTIDTPEVLHRTILMRAVQLAKAVWQS